MDENFQYLFSGLSVGCIYAVVALSLVVVAKVTGVFNFATGEYVMLGGMVTAVMAANDIPLAMTVPLSMGIVAAVAVIQERLTVAPIRGKAGNLGLVIASLGVAVLIRGLTLLIWDEDARRAPAWQEGTFHVLGASLSEQTKWVYLSLTLSVIAVSVFFTRTDTGRAMRASAINPTAARLTGIRIGTTSIAAFALAGGLCGLIASASASLTLVRWDAGITIGLIGFIAAALAGFDSPVKAVLAGLALGVLEAFSAGKISSDYKQAIVYSVLIAYLLLRDLRNDTGVVSRAIKSRRASAAASEDAPELRSQIRQAVHGVEDRVRTSVAGHTGTGSGFVSRLRSFQWLKRSPLVVLPVVLLGLGALYPMTTDDIGQLDTAVFVLLTGMAATGLGLVMGLAGQFSLGQVLYVLVGGYTAALLTADFAWDPLLALLAAAVVSSLLGLAVGAVTLRLQGLNLALATLALLVIAIVFVEREEGITHGTAGVVGVSPLKIFGSPIEEPKDFFLVALGVLAVMLLIARNVWRSRLGRALRAIGTDEEAAESVGLDAFGLKLKVVVLGAAMAGIAGGLWSYYLQFASPGIWDVQLTINLVAYVIVGGLISPYGGIVGAVVVGALQYWVRENLGSDSGGDSSTYELLLSGGLLVLFVLAFRDGLTSVPRLLIDGINRARRHHPEEVTTSAAACHVAPTAPTQESLPPNGRTAGFRAGNGVVPLVPRRAETRLIDVRGLTKRFGSLTAVNDVSFFLRPGYVTAMIGPNGAGKSTIIGMLAGTLIPSEGAVGIMGRPGVGLGPMGTSRLGMARTFQTPRLFEGMTLLETVMLGRDRHGSRAWLTGAALRTPRALRDERESREQALAWLTYVGLQDDAAAPATSLTTGKQRLAELARALATEPTVLLLDEPAAGLDGVETRQLSRIIRTLADTGIAVLLVEHDMGMVMSIADHVVVLEEGKKIAEGTPREVGENQVVVDAYLGVVHA